MARNVLRFFFFFTLHSQPRRCLSSFFTARFCCYFVCSFERMLRNLRTLSPSVCGGREEKNIWANVSERERKYFSGSGANILEINKTRYSMNPPWLSKVMGFAEQAHHAVDVHASVIRTIEKKRKIEQTSFCVRFLFSSKSGSERTQFTILMLHPDARLFLTNFLVEKHNRIQCVSFYSVPFTVASSSSTIRCDSIFIWDPQRCQSVGALASNTNAQLLLGKCCFSRVSDAAVEESEGSRAPSRE